MVHGWGGYNAGLDGADASIRRKDDPHPYHRPVRAIVYERYGPPEVLELRDVDKPVPRDDDVLIRVEAASLNRSDWEGLVGRPLYARIGGLRRPKQLILGSDIAGRVEAVGSAVTTFRPGDEVLGDILYHGASAFSEYVCVPEQAPIVHKPPGIGFEEASTLPQSGVIALQATEGRIRAGDRVLINGAGGGAGTFAIQMAKAAGAEVTAVDNGAKTDLLSSVGADHVLDYAVDDYTRLGVGFDLILDLVCHRSIFAIRRVLNPGGRYLVVGGSVAALVQAVTVGPLLGTGGRKLGVLLARPNKDDLTRLAGLAAGGTLNTVIERTYPLEQVPEALAHLGADRALGKLVIKIG